MQVFRRLPPTSQRRDCALTIGNFDGVHRGHQALLERLRATASSRTLPTCVLTFEPHPREYFASIGRGSAPPRISTQRDKLEALEACGIDRVCVAHFNASLAALSAEQFVGDVIVDGLHARHVLIGDDFRFGAARRGDVGMLRETGRTLGFDVEQMPTVTADGQRVSSSAVREALAAGDFARARSLLGRPYTITGHVTHGRKLGRALGWPTANIRVPFERPAVSGIFVVQLHGLADGPLPGVASLGTRPAIEADGVFLLEAHVFDFDRDVYGAVLGVEFLAKLRDETKFDSLDALKQQIALDAAQARAWFAAHRA